MKIICISGKIGSGKTRFSKNLIHNISQYKIHRKYILYINIDNFVKYIYSKKIIQKKLKITQQKLHKILFYSGNQKNVTTEKMWHNLNKIFKKYIQNYIISIIKNTQNKKYIYYKYKLIIFDIALKNYFTEVIHNIHNPSNTLKTIQYFNMQNNFYKKLFLLKKQRNIQFRKSLKILQQQTTL